MRIPVFLSLILAAGLSRADPCEQLPPPSVKIQRLPDTDDLNKRYGYRTLTQLGRQVAGPGSAVLGLTRGNATARFAIAMPTMQDTSGRWECSSPQITLSLGFHPMTVYVAKEFPEGSCAYKEIYQHERRHVQAYRDHLTGLEKGLLDTLNRRFATTGPWRAPAGETLARLQQELDERWLPYVQREIAGVEAAQAGIDTPEEYARVADSCNGEIRQRLR